MSLANFCRCRFSKMGGKRHWVPCDSVWFALSSPNKDQNNHRKWNIHFSKEKSIHPVRLDKDARERRRQRFEQLQSSACRCRKPMRHMESCYVVSIRNKSTCEEIRWEDSRLNTNGSIRGFDCYKKRMVRTNNMQYDSNYVTIACCCAQIPFATQINFVKSIIKKRY